MSQALAEAPGAGAGSLLREQLLEESSASAAERAPAPERGFVLWHCGGTQRTKCWCRVGVEGYVRLQDSPVQWVGEGCRARVWSSS